MGLKTRERGGGERRERGGVKTRERGVNNVPFTG